MRSAAGAGEGYNLNLPLPPRTNGEWYLKALDLALDRIRQFDPWALVIAVGFDTYGGDPISKFDLITADYADMARRLHALNLPAVIVQEGGYNTGSAGEECRGVFEPFAE